MAYTARKFWKTRPGHQLPLLGVLDAACCGHKGSSVLRSLPSTANATDSKLSKSDSDLHPYAFLDYAATKFVCVQWFRQNYVAAS